jgi:hypothetical protein
MNPNKRRFYFDSKGHIFFETNVFGESTVEQEVIDFKALSERNRDTFNVLELEFGAYARDFAECNGYRVNPVTKELIFSYPDPNNPEAPQVFQKPLTEQIEVLKAEQSQLSADFQGLTDYLSETGVL